MSLNKSNEYVDSLPGSFYDDIPKAVWAAMFLSYEINLGAAEIKDLPALVMKEWHALYNNGIVPQKPIASYKDNGQKVSLPTAEDLENL